MYQSHKFILSWNSTCFGQFVCPSSGVYSLYIQQWCMSYRLVPSWSCSKAVHKPVWHIPLLSVQWINSWWLTEELSETRRVSWQNKFVKLIHLVGFITKKFVTMHGHMNVKKRLPLVSTLNQINPVHSIRFASLINILNNNNNINNQHNRYSAVHWKRKLFNDGSVPVT
jgi:hypothetical protein